MSFAERMVRTAGPIDVFMKFLAYLFHAVAGDLQGFLVNHGENAFNPVPQFPHLIQILFKPRPQLRGAGRLCHFQQIFL